MLNTKNSFFMLSFLIVGNTNLQAGICHSHQPTVDNRHKPKVDRGELRRGYEIGCAEDRRRGDPDVIRATSLKQRREEQQRREEEMLSKTSVGSGRSSLVHSRTTSGGSNRSDGSRASSYDFDRQKIAARRSLSNITPRE